MAFRRPAHDEFTNERPGDAVVTLGVKTDRRYSSYHRYDRWGYRNTKDLTSAPVVLLGDSFVEGYKVTQDSIVSAVLGRLVDLDAANLGQADYGLPHELAALKFRGLSLSPQVVLWFVFEGNDLQEYPASYTLAEGWDPPDYRTRGFLERSFTRNVLTWAIPVSQRLFAPDRDPLGRAGILVDEAGQERLMFFGIKPFPWSDGRERALRDAESILAEGYRLVRDREAQLLVVLVPIKYRVYGGLVQPAPNSQITDWVSNDFPDRLMSSCARMGIPFVDLTDALRRSASGDTLVYYLDDAHWTSAGHHVAAREVAALIVQKGWVFSQAGLP
jgi:hypothetical protein